MISRKIIKKRQTCNAKDNASERLPAIYSGLPKEIKHVVGRDGSENLGVPKNDLIAQLRAVSRDLLTLYVDNCLSKGCRLGKRLKFACLHSNEYRANVPPAITKSQEKKK